MKKYILPAIAAFIISCSGSDSSHEHTIAADSLFPLKNISATGTVTLSNTTHDMDSAQKMELMAPVLFQNKSKEELDYFIHWQAAKFVAKQEKIFDYTPVIVSLAGDDYDAMFYILLDEKNKPVSALQIAGGGICGGPTEISDSLQQGCPERNSYLKGKEIVTYVKRMSFYATKEQHPTIVDSVTYISRILSNGAFETQQKDSTRYTKLFF